MRLTLLLQLLRKAGFFLMAYKQDQVQTQPGTNDESMYHDTQGICIQNEVPVSSAAATTTSVKCRLQAADDPAPDVTSTTTESINIVTFKPKHVKKLLQQLQPDKATGPDHIPTRVLQKYSAELASHLCRLFVLCFSHGVFPSQWKTASVTPIHKRDYKADPTKYRPYFPAQQHQQDHGGRSQKQLQQYLLRNNLISDRQFGFRPGHSTADLLNILSQTWNNHLD